MRNKTIAPTSTEQNHEALVVVTQEFNGSFLAKISNHSKDKQTHAFGKTKTKAEQNAIKNYQLKYNTFYFAM